VANEVTLMDEEPCEQEEYLFASDTYVPLRRLALSLHTAESGVRDEYYEPAAAFAHALTRYLYVS